jgi:predicted transcriptional regulator
MKKIDFKSFLIGFLFSILVVVLASSTSIPSNDIGRYSLRLTEQRYAIIDTKTGAVMYHPYRTDNVGVSTEKISGKKIRDFLNY